MLRLPDAKEGTGGKVPVPSGSSGRMQGTLADGLQASQGHPALTKVTACRWGVVYSEYMTTTTYTYHGWTIDRGCYQDTPDDRLDRWYIHAPESNLLDHRGPGYYSLTEARDAIDDERRAAWDEVER